MSLKLFKSWDTGVRPISSCPYMQYNKKLLLAYRVLKLLELLDSEFSTEFLIYAELKTNSNYDIITNPCIPEQEVSYASVEVLKPCDGLDVVIHKHPSGVKDFSATDDEYINANNKISLLYEGGNIVKAVAKIKLPCGHFAIANIPLSRMLVYVEQSIEHEEEEAQRIFNEQKSRIRDKRYYYALTTSKKTKKTKKKEEKTIENGWTKYSALYREYWG